MKYCHLNKNDKVLFFGPYPKPITGQSISFKQVCDNYDGKKIVFDTTRFDKFKILNLIYCILKLPIVFLFNSFSKVYFTCSRGNLSYVRDIQLLLLCRFFRKRVINHLHGADFLEFYQKKPLRKKLVKYCYEVVQKSIILLPSMKEQFLDFENMKLEVIYNSYSHEFKRYPLNSAKNTIEIVYFSNLMYSKGIIYFLKAVKKILTEHDEIVVKIGGLPMGDNYRSINEIESEFNFLGKELKSHFPERFFYFGLVEGDQRIQLLQKSSIFVLPTFYISEAFPLSIIEAMFFGNVIITTKHNYLGDIVKEDNGILIDVKSVCSIYNALSLLIKDPKLRLKIQKNNHAVAKKKYNPDWFTKSVNQAIYKL